MATRYAVASGDWSDAADVWSDTDGGEAGSYVPVAGDTFVILTGVSVKMDADQSAGAGMAGTNIIRGGATPGMLYWSNGDSGYLKLQSTATLEGTTDTNRGRLLANSDGTWGTTTALQNTDKAVIELAGTTTPAKINAEHLDIALYATHPTNWFVETYETAYTCADQTTGVATATDIITFATAPPAAGTAVRVKSSGTLPTGLSADAMYYTRTISGNTCKLATQNADASIVDITATGTGALTMYDGHTSTSTKTINVIQNVTADTPWATAAGHNFVVLADIGPANYDQQRDKLATINAGSLVLTTNNIDSAQYPCAKIYLSSRNVSIRSTGTVSSATYPMVDYTSGATHGGTFSCELRNTYEPGTQTTFYGYGIQYGVGCIISGTISGCSSGVYFGSGHTISGTISGCSTGVNRGSGHTISGTISGCTFGFYYGSGHTISGTISGCTFGFYFGSGHTISGTISGCNNGVYFGSGHTISGTISGCSYGFLSSSGNTISGTISGCTYGFNAGSGHTISGTISGCTYSFLFPIGFVVVKSGANVTYSFADRNITGNVGRVSVEDYDGTGNAYKVHDAFGDIVKTACDGTGDAPSVDPDAGNGYCVEASNIQSLLAAINPLVIIPSHRIWMTAEAHTVTYKVQTTYAGITAGNLKLWCSYISTTSPVARTITSNAPAIDERSDDADWTQTLAVTFTPSVAGWVDFSIELYEYESGNEVYVWPTPVIT